MNTIAPFEDTSATCHHTFGRFEERDDGGVYRRGFRCSKCSVDAGPLPQDKVMDGMPGFLIVRALECRLCGKIDICLEDFSPLEHGKCKGDIWVEVAQEHIPLAAVFKCLKQVGEYEWSLCPW